MWNFPSQLAQDSMLLLIEGQMHFCVPDLLVLPAAQSLALILFPHITGEMMVLFCLCIITSQSSSIIPPSFRTYMTADFGVRILINLDRDILILY
jgi:hypothetical protein